MQTTLTLTITGSKKRTASTRRFVCISQRADIDQAGNIERRSDYLETLTKEYKRLVKHYGFSNDFYMFDTTTGECVAQHRARCR